MNILIYGSRGWIGSQFKKILTIKNINYTEGKSRVDNEVDLQKEIETINPTHIISFIGRTHGKIFDKEYSTIDYLEEKGKIFENVRDNLFSPIILADICKKRDIHFTYLGTGCIFTFDEIHPYEEEVNGFTEECKPNFFGSSYSTVKGFTDRLMKLYEETALTLRIRMPITGDKNPRNFITKITNYKNICSIKNSMSVLPELLPFIVKLMKDKTVGTLNFTNPGLISHNEILQMYKEIVNPEFTWQNFSKEEQSKILTSDRSNNYLDTTRLETLFPEVLNIKDSVRKVLHEYKNTIYKIDKKYLEKINNQNDNKKYFGDWINNLDVLKEKYNNALPFEYIKLDNFLQKDYAEEIYKSFPTDFENWHKYWNPIEVKYANDDINNMDKSIKDAFYLLSSNKLIEVFSEITQIKNLEYDPYLHGAGLHVHPRYGRLNMHLDYEKHPKLINKQRRLNIILFLTKDWKEEWNGDNQLWDKNMNECIVKTYPKFNSAIIFKTDELSWHGLPEKILCPPEIYRKTLAYYYISPLINISNETKIGNDGSGFRTKATFIKRPQDKYDEKMEQLYKIRPYKRIEKEDMDKIWPHWNFEKN